ncbi:MAG: hypothetical protein Q7S00_00565 [bacterium]|nr:hypothetical protein [bacterium]
MPPKEQAAYEQFLKRVEREIMSHRIIHENAYTGWFQNTDLSPEEVRHFTVQFSVFSNLFIVAQLKKTLNAHSLEEMRTSKEILLSELGVIFNRRTQESAESLQKRKKEAELEGDPELVNTEGTIDGGLFRFRAAHFEWLLQFAKPLGLSFSELGKHQHGTASTLHFTDGLERIYGHADFSIGAGASYAIENWAAAGFWKQLIQGLKRFKEKHVSTLHLGFWTWHDKVEDQHAAHTQNELREIFFYNNFDEDKFIAAGKEMLDCCAVFWDGLNKNRLFKKDLDREN